MYSVSPVGYISVLVIVAIFGLSITGCCCWMHYSEKRNLRALQARMANMQPPGDRFFIPSIATNPPPRRGGVMRSLRNSLRRKPRQFRRLNEANPHHAPQTLSGITMEPGRLPSYCDNPGFQPDNRRLPPGYRASPPPPYSNSPVHHIPVQNDTRETSI